MIPIRIESAWRGTADCRNCAIRDVALFSDLNESDFGKIHSPIDDLEYRAGDVLFREREAAAGVFTVRTGMLKLVRSTRHGSTRIIRVLRQGDVAGIEALATARYDSDAVALTRVSVCRIPLDVINTLGSSTRRLHDRLMGKWQHALKDADDWLADLNFGTAEQRVASLVLKMRNPSDGVTCTLFSRVDMGSMTDLKFETVSRIISRFTRMGILEQIDRSSRTYRIVDIDKLRDAAMHDDWSYRSVDSVRSASFLKFERRTLTCAQS